MGVQMKASSQHCLPSQASGPDADAFNQTGLADRFRKQELRQ
jgi:hypothetical protein